MKNIYKTLLVLWALTLSAFAQTGDNTKILYQFKDALWNQTATTAKDSGSPGGKDSTVEGNGVTFVNNGVGGTAIQYSITSTDAKLSGLTADWGERFVLEARIKKSALEGADSEIHILKNVVTTGLDWYIDTDNKMILKVGDGSAINIISDTAVIGPDSWITLAVVVDLTKTDINEAVKFFINEGEVSTGGPSTPTAINQVVFDETFTARNFNTEPLVIDNLQGDSFDYTVVVQTGTVTADVNLWLRFNNDSGNNYRNYYMYGLGTTPGASTDDNAAQIQLNNGLGTSNQGLLLCNITGSSGAERLTDILYTGDSRVSKNSGYWKNTTNELTEINIHASASQTVNAHIRVYSTPKAASTDNWELVETKSWEDQNLNSTPVSFANLDGDLDGKYLLKVESANVASTHGFKLNINNDSSTNYSVQQINNSNGSIGSSNYSNQSQSLADYNNSANTQRVEWTIYPKTGVKRLLTHSSSRLAGTSQQIEGSTWWNNTIDNITSLQVGDFLSQVSTGSAILYKLKDPAGVADKYNLPFEVVESVDINEAFSAGHTFSGLTGDSEFMYKLEGSFSSGINTASGISLRFEINGDTGSNYMEQTLKGISSSTYASSATRTYGRLMETSPSQVSHFSMYINPQPGNTRPMLLEAAYREAQVDKVANWWNNTTDEITSIKVFSGGSSVVVGNLTLSKIPLSVAESSGQQQQTSSNTSGTYTAYVPSDYSYNNSYSSGDRSTLIDVTQVLPAYAGSFTNPENLVNGDEAEDVTVPNTGNSDPLWGIEFDFKGESLAFEEIQLLTSTNVSGNHAVQFYEGWNGSSWIKVSGDFAISTSGTTTTLINNQEYFTKLRFRGGNTGFATNWKEIKFNCSVKIPEERSAVLTALDTSTSIIPQLTSNTDQGYTVTGSSNYGAPYQFFNVFNESTSYNWYVNSQEAQSISIVFPSPKNVSAVSINESYHVSYPTGALPSSVKVFVINLDDSEKLVASEQFEMGELLSFHSEVDVKGVKIEVVGANGVGMGDVDIFSGTYSPGQPQTPFQSVQIPQAEGTAVGDLTGNGGLAAAFNGTLHETYIAASSKNTQTDASIGKDWGSGNEKAIGKLIMYGPSNQGFFNQHGNATYSFQISDDGTTWEDVHVIAEAHNNVGNLVKEVNILSPVKSRFFRVHLSNTLTAFPYMSELKMFEAKALDGSEYVSLIDVAGFSLSQVSQEYGIPVGDNGYLTSMFNGVVEAGSSSSGGYTIGKDWGGEKQLGQIKFYGPTNRGIYTNVGDLIVLVEGWNGTTWEEITTKTFVGQCSTSNFVGEITDLDSINTQHRITITSSFGDSSMFMSEVEFYELTPYFGFPSSGAISVGPVALAASSTYTSGIYPTISGENAIEVLSKTGAFSVESDFVKMTLKRPDVEFDVANFQKSEGYKVDSDYNLTGTTSSSIYIYPPKLLRRVNNPPTDFDNLGLPKEGVVVDVDNGTGGKVFYGVFQFEFALSQAISENVTVDVFMKTGDFDFKKVAEIKPTPKPANAETPWVIRNYWNARSTQFDWDGNAYKTTGAVQFKLEVR